MDGGGSKAMNTRVAVTGMGVVTGCGTGQTALYDALRTGQSSVRPVELFDVSTCRCRTAAQVGTLENPSDRIPRKAWGRLDRASKMLLTAAQEALEEARLASGPIHAPLVLGSSGGGMRSGELYHRALLQNQSRRHAATWLSDYLAQQQPLHVQRFFDVTGPVLTLANACASSANAIGYSAQLIAHGEADCVIAGGYDALSELIFVGFDSLMAATPTLCRPFDKRRDGMVLGEGAAVLVLEKFECASARHANILAEIRGYGQSIDTHHITQPHPEGDGAYAAMRLACETAGVEAGEIDYVNAHGTATPQNDAMEAKAIRRLLNARAAAVPVSSTKATTGHTVGAAGAVESVISILALKNQFVPPNVNFESPDEGCALNVPAAAQSRPLRTVLSNSFGFGGLNASLLFSLP